jgi:mRNA-degrading endonuclease YafQ of YafQ-DinJ toxin-antitoxin module
MIIHFSAKYKIQYQKLPLATQKKTRERILLWQEDPYNPILRLHPLRGQLAGFYSINITGDIRAIYEVVDSEVYVYQMIGSHAEL